MQPDEFHQSIEALRAREISVGDLVADFDALVASDAEAARVALADLQELVNQGRFPPQLVTMLEGHLPTAPRRRPRPMPPTAAGPAAADGADERTVVVSAPRWAPRAPAEATRPSFVPPTGPEQAPTQSSIVPPAGPEQAQAQPSVVPLTDPEQAPTQPTQPSVVPRTGPEQAQTQPAQPSVVPPTGPEQALTHLTQPSVVPPTGPEQAPTQPSWTPATQPTAPSLAPVTDRSQPSLAPVTDTSGTAGSGRSDLGWSAGVTTGGTPVQYPAQAGEPEVGTLLRKRFMLEAVLGRGGMGVVYKARDLSREAVGYTNLEENYVAIKLLNDEFKRHPESIKVFGREFRNTQQLRHPNIVNLYDFDRDEFGNYFIAMELLVGEPLNKLVRRVQGTGLPFAEAFPLIDQMGRALAAAHGLPTPIIHSDFKPGNVFLGRDRQIKVFDFGIARAARPSSRDTERADQPDNVDLTTDLAGDATSTHHEGTTFVQGLGALTVAYASPEMLLGQDPDARDDLYALAIVAYQLLAGERPFLDPKCDFTQPKCRTELLKARSVMPKRPPGLTNYQWKALQQGLAFDRGARCQDVQAFLDHLRPRPSRLPWAIAAGLVGAGVLGWFFGLAPWLAEREQSAALALTERLQADIAAAAPATLEPLPAAAAQLPPALQNRLSAAVIDRLAALLLGDDETLRAATRERLAALPEATRNATYDRARRELTGRLRGADADALLPYLPVVLELPPVQRAQIMAEIGDPLRETLLDASRAAFVPESDILDYARARTLLEQAEQLQPGLKVIADERAALSARYDRLLSNLDERINRLREQGQLLARTDGDSVPAALAVLGQLAPDQYPKYAWLDSFYSAAARAAEGSDLTGAMAYVRAGLELFPDSAELKNQRSRIEDLIRGQTREQALVALRGRIDSALTALGDGPPPRELLTALGELRAAAPTDPLLTRAGKRALAACDDALPTLLAARDWAGAQRLLDTWAGMADEAAIGERRSRITAAREAHAERIAALQRSLRDQLAGRDLAAAERTLTSLAEAVGEGDVLARSRDELARAWLAVAREARDGGRFAEARERLTEAARRASDPTLARSFAEERERIDAAEAASRQQLAAAEQARLAAERTARIEAIRTEFADRVARMPVTAEGVAAARGLLDRLAGLAPDDPLLRTGLEAIAGRFASAAAEQGQAGRWEEAVVTIENGKRLLPGLTILDQEGERIAGELARAQAERTRAALVRQQGVVDDLLGQADFSADWASRTAAALADLTRLGGGEADPAAAAGERIDRLYGERLDALITDNQFAEARGLMTQWQDLRPRANARREQARQSLEQAFVAWEQAEAGRQQRAAIEAGKQTLLTQARADQADKALATLESLRGRLPADDPFLTRQAPGAIADSYLRMASQSTRRGRHDTAENLIGKAVALAPGVDVTAVRRELDRNRARDAFTSRLAAAADAEALAALAVPLADVRGLAGEEYPGWVGDWGKALAERIQAAPPETGAALLAAARQLFPDDRALARVTVPSPGAMVMPTPPARPTAALAQARAALEARALSAAETALASARATAPNDPELAEVAQLLDGARANAQKAYKLYELAISRAELAKAERARAAALALWTDNPQWQQGGASGTRVAAARPVPATSADPCNPRFAEYGNNRNARCADSLGGNARGPELVVVPAGGGNPRPFAVSRYEISVAEFNAYCTASRECQPVAARSGKLPVTGISITQAEQYAAWLSRLTGATYRLPTAGEWQHAATARGETPPRDANCLLRSGGQIVKGGAPDLVSTGVTNGWGLVNAVGNVQEWSRTGAAVQAHGGHYAEDATRCSVTTVASHSGRGDAYTGFRLVKEIRG